MSSLDIPNEIFCHFEHFVKCENERNHLVLVLINMMDWVKIEQPEYNIFPVSFLLNMTFCHHYSLPIALNIVIKERYFPRIISLPLKKGLVARHMRSS